jgi:hypothetical protein
MSSVAKAPSMVDELARLQAAIDEAHRELVSAGNALTEAVNAADAYQLERPKEMAKARAGGKSAPKDRTEALESAAREARVEHDAADELVRIRVQEMVDAIEENKGAWQAEAEQRVDAARSELADAIGAAEARAHELAQANADLVFLSQGGVYWNERMGRFNVRPRNVAPVATAEFAALRRAAGL